MGKWLSRNLISKVLQDERIYRKLGLKFNIISPRKLVLERLIYGFINGYSEDLQLIMSWWKYWIRICKSRMSLETCRVHLIFLYLMISWKWTHVWSFSTLWYNGWHMFDLSLPYDIMDDIFRPIYMSSQHGILSEERKQLLLGGQV